MKRKISYSIALLLLVLISCQSNESTQETLNYSRNIDIPELLDRPNAIQYGKEWETAQNVYGNALNSIRQKGDQPEALINLATLYIQEARITGEHGHYYPGALAVLDRALELDITTEKPDFLFQALTLKATVLLAQHEFEDALVIAKKAIQLNPYNAQIYGVLVDAYVELGQYEEAIAMADKMTQIRPDARSYARVSYLREIYGDVNGAIEALSLAVTATYPGQEQRAWMLLTLGNLYEQYGQLEAAKLQYQQILAERTNQPFAIAALGDIAYKQGNLTEAEAQYKKAAAIIPEVGFYESLAALYNENGATEQYKSYVKEVLLMLEDDVIHGHNMNLEYASLYHDLLDDQEQALQFALSEYEKRPENIDVNQLLATIYYELKDWDKANEHLVIAKRTGSKKPQLKCLEGLLAIQNGDTKNGIELLQLAIQSNPYQSHPLINEATTYL